MTDTTPLPSPEFSGDHAWFHVFRSMYTNGDVAKLGTYAHSVYLAIKAHTNFKTGQSFPSHETIANITGMSDTMVKRGLARLQEMDYVTVEKKGRKNHYTLREKIALQDDQGRPAAVATWDYVPGSVTAAVADLKNVLLTGDLAGAKIVHIERLVVNVNNVAGNQINVHMAGVKDPDLKQTVKEVMKTAAENGGTVVIQNGDQF